MQFRIGTYYIIRSYPSLIYNCLRKMVNVLWYVETAYRSRASEFALSFLAGFVLRIFLVFFVLSYYVSLHPEFRVVMSVTISAIKRSSVCPYLQLFVGGSCLSIVIYVCFAHSSVLCKLLLVCFSLSCVPYVASFSGLFISDFPFGIL